MTGGAEPARGLEPAIAWRVASRTVELRGEQLASLVRLVGIGLLYCVQLANRYGLPLGPLSIEARDDVSGNFHFAMTILALLAALLAASVLIAVRNRFFPEWMKYATTAADVGIAVAALGIADGPSSQLTVVFFPILALAALRLSVGLTRFAAAATATGYLLVVGHTAWLRPELSVPVYEVALFLVALGLTGLVTLLFVGQVRRAAGRYASALSSAHRGEAPAESSP